IPTAMPPLTDAVWTRAPEADVDRGLRTMLAHRGFLEAVSLAFNARAQLDAFGFELANVVEVANPLGEESALMRVSLLPALLRAARHNQDVLPSITDLRLFELGRTFLWRGNKLPEETPRLALLLRGHRVPDAWATKNEKGQVAKVDAFDVKAEVDAILGA